MLLCSTDSIEESFTSSLAFDALREDGGTGRYPCNKKTLFSEVSCWSNDL